MNSEQRDTTIIVAAFNEEENILKCVESVFQVLPECQFLLVHGGTDRTAELCATYKPAQGQIRIIHNHPDLGKGHAIRVGAEAATTRYIWRNSMQIPNLMRMICQNY
jgi:glycosyltransferase involved in cell wall biosynthesis